jgi:hypothetical protein
MLRSRRLLAALLLSALPLNAQVTRVAAPTLVPASVVPAAVFAAQLFAAPSLSAAPSLGAFSLSAPALTAAPVPSLPASALAAAPAAAAAPALLPAAAAEGAAAVPSFSGTAPLAAAADGPRRKDLPGVRAAAADVTSFTFGSKLFDGASDLVTRSGSVFTPSRTAVPALRGGVAFVRVQAAPAAPVKAVPDTQGLKGSALLDRVSSIAAKGQTKHEYHDASKYLFSTADNHTLNGTPE